MSQAIPDPRFLGPEVAREILDDLTAAAHLEADHLGIPTGEFVALTDVVDCARRFEDQRQRFDAAVTEGETEYAADSIRPDLELARMQLRIAAHQLVDTLDDLNAAQEARS